MVSIQPNMQVHDDLATLFSRNLTLSQPPPLSPPAPEPQIVYSISQHYHHSAHLAKSEEHQHQNQRPSSLPPPDSGPSVEQILSAHGVDPSALSDAQTQLFRTAEDQQKMRLIELWRICPPEPVQANSNGQAWNATTVELEEALTRIRFERRQQEDDEMQRQLQLQLQHDEYVAQQREMQQHAQQQQQQMSLDGTLVPFQGGDSRWNYDPHPTAVVPLVDSSNRMDEGEDAEPYITTGYDQMARREYEASASTPRNTYAPLELDAGGQKQTQTRYCQATDPVYCRNLENQYGGYEMRGTWG